MKYGLGFSLEVKKTRSPFLQTPFFLQVLLVIPPRGLYLVDLKFRYLDCGE